MTINLQTVKLYHIKTRLLQLFITPVFYMIKVQEQGNVLLNEF